MSWKKGLTAVLAVIILFAVGCGTNGTPSPSATRLGAIQGTVTDESGGPVPTVRVFIVGGTVAFPEISPETDEKGLYQIGGVNPGTFEVAFHDRNGDRIGLDSVNVIGGETSTLDLHIVGSHGGPVTDYVSLVDNLRAAGATVDPAGTVSQPFFVPVGKAAQVFEELGCTVDEAHLELDNPVPTFLDIFYTNNYTSYGHLLDENPGLLTDNARFCLEHGRGLTGADYARALRAVDLMRARLDDLMENYDLLLTPTMAVTPFPIGQYPERIGGQEVQPRSGYSPLTRPFNLTGQPAASIPGGYSEEGLPVGLQIVGRLGEEETVLRASASFEGARPWAHNRPPLG